MLRSFLLRLFCRQSSVLFLCTIVRFAGSNHPQTRALPGINYDIQSFLYRIYRFLSSTSGLIEGLFSMFNKLSKMWKCGYNFSNNFIVSIHSQHGHVKGMRNAENMTIILQPSLLSTFTINWSINKFIYYSKVPSLLQLVWTQTYSWFNVGRSHGSWQCQN